MQKTWLITGTSKGFGRVWAEAALKRGDNVAATARDIDTLKELTDEYGNNVLPIVLNVDDRKACFRAVQQAHTHFGKLDVLVSNAGYGHFGFIEELSEADARAQIETNLFGSLWMIQAVLPIMREQGSGRILQVSSIGGVATFPGIGMYHISKWGVEALCDTLYQEVSCLGIKITLIEPGGYHTDWSTASAKHSEPIAAYEPVRDQRKNNAGKVKKGDPGATAEAILKIVDAEEPPLRLFLGNTPLKTIEPIYAKRLDEWREWKETSEQAQGND
jgi:NADP-dependent 3-hydroxy acid dehydrogenase YdfG